MALDDHVRKGKKLLPPLMAANFPLELGNWPIDRVPDFFWLAGLVERNGKHETVDLVFELCSAIDAVVSNERGTNEIVRSYLLSEHAKLSNAERLAVVRKCQGSKWFTVIEQYASDLLAVLPELPIGYLGKHSETCSSQDLAVELKHVLSKISHRHDPLALFVQTIVVTTEIRLGHLGVAEGIPLPNFEAILDYPNTHESLDAAGFVVPTCAQLTFVARESDFPWHRAFWNACYRLQPCEFNYE